MRKYVVYTRVSTAEQGRSGLGLEAQRRDIDIFLDTFSEMPWEIVGEFCDVQSGKDDDRPSWRGAGFGEAEPAHSCWSPSSTGSPATLRSSRRR